MKCSLLVCICLYGICVWLCVCVCVHSCFQGHYPSFSNLPYKRFCTEAGACDTLILSHATKLWIRVGRETWPVSCTCTNCLTYSKELMHFVETFN